MDTIMQYTGGATTAVATFAFAATFLAGVWAAAKYGKLTLLPALAVIAGSFYVRVQFDALSAVAISSMCALHLASGCVLGLCFRRSKRFGQPAKS